MKTLFIALSLFFSGLLMSFNHQVEDPAPEIGLINTKAGNSNSPAITIKIDLGRKKRNCTGLGICGFRGFETVKFGASNMAVARNVNGRLSLEFVAKTISFKDMKRYFNRRFVMEEAVEIPNSIRTKLGLRQAIIPAGKFRLKMVKGNPVVTF